MNGWFARVCALALRHGLSITVSGTQPKYNYDGAGHAYISTWRQWPPRQRDAAKAAAHELAHYIVATPTEHRMINFGLGPGPTDSGRKDNEALPRTRADVDGREMDVCIVDTLLCAHLQLATIRSRSCELGSEVGQPHADDAGIFRGTARLLRRGIITIDRDYRLVLSRRTLSP